MRIKRRISRAGYNVLTKGLGRVALGHFGLIFERRILERPYPWENVPKPFQDRGTDELPGIGRYHFLSCVLRLG